MAEGIILEARPGKFALAITPNELIELDRL
jgi:hypothetical protein